MKKRSYITAFLTAMMMIAPCKMSAQEENGFQEFNVMEDFADNGFPWFRDAQLQCAGNKEKSNAMTIGWGGIAEFQERRTQEHVQSFPWRCTFHVYWIGSSCLEEIKE